MEYYVLIVAAGLVVAIGIVHSWLGEVRLIGPLLSPEHRSGILAKHQFARQILRFAWHITTLAWWGFAAVLALLAASPIDGQGRIVLLIIAVTFCATGLVTLITSRGRHLAWPLFFAVAGLTCWPLM